MTHTLHPEILDEIVNSMNHYVDKHMYHALGMKKVLEKHLGPYLLPPSQHLKDEPTQTLQDFAANQMNVDDMKKDGSFINKVEDNEPLPEPILLGTDFSKEDDIGCEIYGYVKDNKTVITKVNYVTPYVEEEQKQSTLTKEEARKI